MAAEPLTPASTVRRNRDVIAHPLEGELVMVDLDGGSYYGLSATGRRIWELLDRETRVAELCDRLVQEFAVAPEACREQVLGFLERLRDQSLLVVGERA